MWRNRVILLTISGILIAGLLALFAGGGHAASSVPQRSTVCVTPPANMVGWYALDETSGTTMTDLTGSYNGTYFNNPAVNAGHYVLNSRTFDGVSQYGQAASGPNFDAGDFTIDAWVNLTSTGMQVLMDKRDATPVGYMMFINDGHLGVQLADSTGFTNYTLNGPATLNDGQWHFVAVTTQRAGAYLVTLVADSTSQAYANSPRTGSLSNTNALRLARNWPNAVEASSYYNGSLDEVELFNRALSLNELTEIRTANTAGKCKPQGNTPTSTVTPMPTNTATSTSISTVIPTITATPTSTRTSVPTDTAAPTRTAFPPGAATKTATPTATGTPPTPVPTATSCYTYGIIVGTGTIIPATTLVPGSNCDDCTVDLDLTDLGFYFPFYDLFDVHAKESANAPDGPPIMRKMRLSANGSIDLSSGTATPSPTTLAGKGAPNAPGVNVCLPAPNTYYSIFPHWDDLRLDCDGCGIFTSITGATGSRIYDVEWRGEYYLCGGRVDVELRMHESTGDFEFIYGQVDQAGSLTTIGVQRDPETASQYACNTSGSVGPGTMLSFTRQSCGAATPTPVATVTGTPPTATSTYAPVVVCDLSPTATPSATATATACSIQFSDVPADSTFYSSIRCLACRGIINGYSDGRFRPGNNVTRGQLAKIVSNAANFNDSQTVQMFQDVEVGSTFFLYIGRLVSRGFISGYPCGGQGEPCGTSNMPYFRPNSNATRGQISKIVSNAAGLSDPPGTQIFEDVASGSTFYDFIQRLASRGYIEGYTCGRPSEPCNPPGNRPYFRPNSNASRGQTAKIVSNTFFPGCSTPELASK